MPVAPESIDLPSGAGQSDPVLSLGLSSFDDWSTEFPFLDLMKQARPWMKEWADGYSVLESGGYLDENGWPTEIPDGWSEIRTIWALPEPMGSGNYVLTYEGQGTIGLAANVTSSEPGRIEFSANAQFWMDIKATDPNGTGDYIKNIRIVPAEYEDLADAGEIFNPDFLSVIEDARQLRFMDWMQTNWSTQSEWADRPQVSDAMWTKAGGVPLEIMVELANKVGADPWFNMPHMATDDYIENFATYVRDNLDPGLVANVEYSNETWNFSFGQYNWLAAQAQAEWGVAPGGDAWIQYSAMRATQTALIWDEVFGTNADARVYNVIGVQMGWQGLAEAQLNASLWQQKDPGSFVDPKSVFDAVGITNYFGGAHTVNEALRNELLAQINAHPDDPETVYDWLTDRLINRADIEWSVAFIKDLWGNWRSYADNIGLDLVAYEGGSHEHHLFGLNLPQADIDKLTAFYTGYSYSPQIAEVYKAMWDAWAEVGDGPFMQFGSVATPSKWGSWSMLRSLTDSNARADMLYELNENTPSWFGNGGGTQYLQGVIKLAKTDNGETITGTDKDDTLVGGDGNDTFFSGNGNDKINGGKGNDTYHVGAGTPFIVDTAGWDTMVSSIGRDMNDYAFIENLTLTGTANINVIGNAWSNTIIGNDGDNVIDGGPGNDTLKGGLGNDTYVLAGSNDTVIDTGGNDTITSSISRDLRNYTGIENLTLTFGANVDGTGNDVANVITGNSGHNTLLGFGGNDTLYGNAGNDILDGGAGNDVLNGGAGNDTYILGDGNDTVIDSTGIDTITSSITRDLNNYIDVEHLTLTGTGNINGTGSKYGNIITGNSGNNSLWGNDGNDTLIGGAGTDKLYGGTGNDILQGGAGNDTLTGGTGNDTYVLEDGNDTVIDEGGWDTITSSISRDLNNYLDIEILTLTGTANINGTGNKWSNTINGNDGDNILDGGAGADTLAGGLGNDTYMLGNATNDTIIDIGGNDTIVSTSGRDLRDFTGIENLTLTFGAHVDGTGDANANKLTGNSGNNVLRGLAGNDVIDGAGGHDTIIGGLGTDTLTGGAGRDIFRFETLADSMVGAGRDVIRDFVRGQDTIDLSAITDGGTLRAAGAAFTGVEDQIRWYQVDLAGTASDVTRVELDANGDGVADLEIELSGLHALTRSDFLL